MQTRCVDGRLMRHVPQEDDPDLEADIGVCPSCDGAGCEPAKTNIPWIVCGRLVGTASGWDQGDTFAMNLYDFIPNAETAANGAKPGTIYLDFERGLWEQDVDENGVPAITLDLIEVIHNAPKRKPER